MTTSAPKAVATVSTTLTAKMQFESSTENPKNKKGIQPKSGCIPCKQWWAPRESNTAPTDYEFIIQTRCLDKLKQIDRK